MRRAAALGGRARDRGVGPLREARCSRGGEGWGLGAQGGPC